VRARSEEAKTLEPFDQERAPRVRRSSLARKALGRGAPLRSRAASRSTLPRVCRSVDHTAVCRSRVRDRGDQAAVAPLRDRASPCHAYSTPVPPEFCRLEHSGCRAPLASARFAVLEQVRSCRSTRRARYSPMSESPRGPACLARACRSRGNERTITSAFGSDFVLLRHPCHLPKTMYITVISRPCASRQKNGGRTSRHKLACLAASRRSGVCALRPVRTYSRSSIDAALRRVDPPGRPLDLPRRRGSTRTSRFRPRSRGSRRLRPGRRGASRARTVRLRPVIQSFEGRSLLHALTNPDANPSRRARSRRNFRTSPQQRDRRLSWTVAADESEFAGLQSSDLHVPVCPGDAFAT